MKTPKTTKREQLPDGWVFKSPDPNSIVQKRDTKAITWEVIDSFNMDAPTRRLFDVCIAQKTYELALTRDATDVCRFTADELVKAGFGENQYVAMVHFWDRAKNLSRLRWDYRRGGSVLFVGIHNRYDTMQCEIDLNPHINWEAILTTKPQNSKTEGNQ